MPARTTKPKIAQQIRSLSRPAALPFTVGPGPDGIVHTDAGEDMVEVVLRIPRSTRDLIDQRRVAAGYRSRTRYLVDGVCHTPLPDYEELAMLMGRVGFLADQLLLGHDGSPLSPRTARQVGRALLEATRELMSWVGARR